MSYLKMGGIRLFILTLGIFIIQNPVRGVGQRLGIAQDPPRIVEFMGAQPMTRVGRPFVVLATINNPDKQIVSLDVELVPIEHIHIIDANRRISLSPGEEITIKWKLVADKPLYRDLQLEIRQGKAVIAAEQLPVRFLPAMQKIKESYIPEPKPPVDNNKKLLIGAHYFPGWEPDHPQFWEQELKHPERTPALGFYDQGNPEVADWETKWAVEHGIDFFIYCWYRAKEGGPVVQNLGSALDARLNSRFKNDMKFAIMWENQNKGKAGVANEADLMNNLLPFWINTYFKRSDYLIIDNKPVLFIYRPEFLVDDNLGSVEKVHEAFDKMRQACKAVGFDGLWILGEYRDHDIKHFELMKELGLDYVFEYCWYIGNSPNPQQAIDSQMEQIRETQKLSALPQVVTVSQGWSGWQDEGSIWAIPPIEYETLLRRVKSFVDSLPKNTLSSRMLLLDNWNEWSEGHYLAPCTEYGFGYLDAIRRVFLNNYAKHVDLIPEDIGRPGYESEYRKWLGEQRKK